MNVVWEVVRAFDVLGSAWVLAWAVEVFRVRKGEDDSLHGEWLALSWAMFLLATVFGTGALVLQSKGFTPGLPFVTAGVVLGAVARWKATRGGADGRPDF